LTANREKEGKKFGPLGAYLKTGKKQDLVLVKKGKSTEIFELIKRVI